jgi:hypothetical protein
MKKKFLVIPILVLTLMLMLACNFADTKRYESPNTNDPGYIEWRETALANASPQSMNIEESGSAPADATPEPEYQPADSQGSGDQNPETANAGSHEYSVEATNFDCTCQVNGNITPIIKFTGNQVEFPNADGSGLVYDKIGDNTYKRTWMGYYILRNGSGAQATDTTVDEERATVLIFSGSGYRMESYQGTEETPCCYFTFTIVK